MKHNASRQLILNESSAAKIHEEDDQPLSIVALTGLTKDLLKPIVKQELQRTSHRNLPQIKSPGYGSNTQPFKDHRFSSVPRN